MQTQVNLICTRERLGEAFTELRAATVPNGQVVGDTFNPPEGCNVATGWETFSYQFSTLGGRLAEEIQTVGTKAISAIRS